VNQEFDLSAIDVIVTAEEVDGKVLQTVEFHIPEELLPLLYPELYGQFYYKESPVRLLYQVGLTQKSIEECNNMEIGDEKVFYTNRWQGTICTLI
jgi:hypothetical protein